MSHKTSPPLPNAPLSPEVRIKQAIFGLSEHLTSQVRAFTDSYYQFIAPTMARWGDTRFPTGVCYHPRDPERTSMRDKENVLYFHIGSTILAYYGVVQGKPTATPLMEARIKLLEDIGKRGYSSFVVAGNEASGYALCHRNEVPVRFNPPEQLEFPHDDDKKGGK